MKAAAFEHLHADSAASAVALLASASGYAKPCSGTQSLGPMLNLRLAQADQLVRVSHLEALKAFALQPTALRIGAAVTHARIEDGLLPDVTHGLLPSVAASIAYRAVRNRGTLGGSLAHADPAADWVTTMCLLDAGVVVLGPQGERSVRCTEFFIGPFTTDLAPDEIIVAVDVPRFSPLARWAYRKVCRKPGEFAEAAAAAWVDPAQGIARVVLGALGGMPHVVEGAAAVAALARPDALAAVLDAAGLDEPYERQLHTTMLQRALQDIDRSQRAVA